MKNKLEQPIIISITLGAVFKVIIAFLLFYLMFVLRNILLILLTAVIVASAIEPATKFFIKKRIPRVIGVLIVYAATISLLAGIFYTFVPPLVGDAVDVVDSLPEYITTLSESDRFNQVPQLSSFLKDFSENTNRNEFFQAVGNTAGNATASVVTTFSTFFGGIISTMLIIVFSFYLAVQEDGVANLIRLITPVKNEKYAIDLWKRSQKKIGLWMQGQLLLSVIIAVLTYLGLTILGIENALFLAFVAGLFELIPVFGPILAAIPAVTFALLQDGVSLALIVTGMYIIIQQFESQLIHPLVVKKIVGIPALIAILALIVGGQIAGFLGVVISVPVTAAIMEYITDVEKKKAKQLKELGELS
jgi:predicted PurR-regulated permease PerM